ncbi:FecR domain-containing protein [Pseudomonas sp. DG56-2]|uniref:FecR domain-containing protein n=1 Tax=Pseudomonas sp. DG56-2 TaxID=2320270 RepID=UPI0010A60011|nr:FecR domain-containing protein [Pseudomonas sp. DG56-2]
MPTPDSSPKQQHVDQAIEWLVKLRFDTPTVQTNQRFQRWLEQPEHAQAWQRVAQMSDEITSLPASLARNTLQTTERRRISRRDSLKLLGLLTVASSLGWINRNRLGLSPLLADNHTGTGEQRTLDIQDGSQIKLNTDSAIDLHFNPHQRLLTLVRGEIIVDVSNDTAHGNARPFRIQTRDGYLETRDSHLLVRENSNGMLLAIKRGEVKMYPGAASASNVPRIVYPGETLLFDAQGQVRQALTHSDPWGWSDGVLSVQQMPLGEFVTELGRYRPGLLRCADEVAALKVSGTYQLANTDQILNLIAQSLPIRVDYRTRFWVSISAS